ncbi:hypothetical protein ACFPM0_18870 [Pseudonocardia sulfidoxydans]|uniref:hypothetical protein n=1 Tax=Pseudonocardia sulfidoxydans TaxID=54011 RepID=UPI00360B978B
MRLQRVATLMVRSRDRQLDEFVRVVMVQRTQWWWARAPGGSPGLAPGCSGHTTRPMGGATACTSQVAATSRTGHHRDTGDPAVCCPVEAWSPGLVSSCTGGHLDRGRLGEDRPSDMPARSEDLACPESPLMVRG